MMNGEGPSVPITTLAGIQSLTDLLLELPLPTPLPSVTGHQSLLSHLRDSEEARRLLSTQESILIPPLIDALGCTVTDHIEVKDGYYGSGSHSGQLSQLVQYLLGTNPGLFKGSMHELHGGSIEHHVPPGQWLQRQCSNIPVHSQPHAFTATAVSPCQPRPTQDNSPNYFPLEHPPTPQGARIVQSKTLNVVPPKSPAAYSPYANPVVSSGQHPITPLHHNAISQGTTDSLSSGLQESPQIFNSPLVNQHIINVSQSSAAIHPFSNGNCVDDIDLSAINTKQNDRTENHILIPPQVIGGLAPNCSPLISPLNNPNDISSSSSSSSAQHINSSSVIVGPTVPQMHINCMKKPIFEQWQPVPNNSYNISHNSFSKTNVYSVSNNVNVSMVENIQPLSVPELEIFKENQPNNHLESKEKNENAMVPEDDKLKVASEPLVVLSKLSIEEQLLAQKSVKQFIKTQKSSSSPEPIKHPTPSKNIEMNNQRRFSTCKEFETNKASSRRRGRNNEYCPVNRKNSEVVKDKGLKRNSIVVDDKIYNNTSSLSERVKKRRRTSQQATYMESLGSNDENSDGSFKEDVISEKLDVSPFKVKKLKSKKVKKEFASEPLSVEDLMDTNTYQHFSRTVDAIFDSVEDIDFSAVIDEDAECAAEVLIPLNQLQDLSNEAAKLKRLHAMNQFPPERLVRLLTILERNIIDGAKLLPVQGMEEQDEEEARLFLELTMERVMRSAEASLTALYVMTSQNMPEKVFLEDVIERIVLFLKYQLQNTVFPVFDPAYRLDPKSKDGYAGNIKQKRAHAHRVKEKSILQLYNKLHETVSLLAELLELQTLTDTIILQVSTLGVSPFFVEGISELQLNALRLVTTVFSRYEKHRQLILEDILASIARLPTSKRSLRNYRLNSEENIQMLTALVLQLIHSVVKLPEPDLKAEYLSNEERPNNPETKEKIYVDKDVLFITSYEASVTTAVNFLSVFLKKCGTKNEEMDYRPLFENFVQDLLSTVNKPEWPASELLLSVLGRILVRNFSNKSMEMTLRVASLDYLGVVAARLRKDAVTSQDRKDMINDVIQRIMSGIDDLDSSTSKSKKKNKKRTAKRDETQILQKALLQYLDSNAESDPALQFARRFYIAQWYRDAAAEIKRSNKSLNFPKEEAEKADKLDQSVRSNKIKIKRARTSRRRSSQITYEEEEEEDEEDEEKNKEESKVENDEVNAKILALAEERKRFLLTVIKKQEPPKVNMKEEEHIDYKTAELISQYLASTRYFSKSFDLYLSQILRVLSETAVAVRTKAMKCLTLVVEADPSILSRPDMQKGVHGRLLDHSTSVREAAVDLLGKFILIRPELISQYYEMLTERILDTGVSVRKRVIKILKDICLEHPDFPKTSEICVKIIRRVNDEDGIKKLVGEVFQSMWFTPTSEKNPQRILQKVKNITHVVEACRDTGLEWFEQLLTNLLKNKEDSNYKSVIKSCKQIVDCLVENLLQLEESSQNVDGGASPHLVACLATLHLFSKIYPPFVVPHATTIQPYLSMRCNTHSDFLLLKNVAQTLELIVPLIEHPSETFLAQIEEDMVKLILRQHMGLLPSCVSCLGAVVNKVTHNYQLVRDCFQKFFVVLLVCKKEYEKNPGNHNLKAMRPKLLRSLYTVGLFCRHFDFDAMDTCPDRNSNISLKDRVFEGILYFNQHHDEVIRLKALTGLGFIMIRHYEFMLGPEVKSLYHYLLTSPGVSSILKCQVLKNITNYLIEEELRMIQKDAEWSKNSKSEDLKEMGDITSGMASTVIQLYLKQVLECVLHTEINVRKASLQVIQLILGQGLVHPVQIVPYLVCLGSDDDPIVRTKADQLLQEIEKKYPGFIQMKAMLGVRMSFKMQQLIRSQDEILRGFRTPDTPVSRNGFLYSVMRSTRQSRRAFLFSLLKLFDEQTKTPLTELLYIADNIAYFPYMAQDEPLFIMHQLDIMLSVSGSNLLQTFRESLLYKQASKATGQSVANNEIDDDDDDDDYDSILERLPEDTSVLQECIIASQGCVLLLYVKQTLKEMYGFTDNKIQQYSPNETAKVYERPLNRKGHVRFNPETVIDFIKRGELQLEGKLDMKGRQQLVQQYLHFKQLMLTIDPSDDDDEEDNQAKPVASIITITTVTNTTEMTANNENTEGDTKPSQPSMQKTKIVISRKCKSPSHTRHLRKSPKVSKEKVKKKHKKKRKRLLDSASEDSGSDPDYMDSS
ncbi:nipped-B-like protein [Argiope bruennichi]|uniref:Nipped-B protein n=1 Tax=Argiope bruennichi TaxID=94029 RepID=A0A8T0EZM9_ARGBR|nr:nipped-B-like protein [Argiope bruennichi]XP_055926312.1 nipped-B-like protein [Argiope bruennichi]XP_055926313.1 nipped-B-like protein [Argiope bruennichi]XP_055926315.1 nipped-B-like protein [Argiope bruennichi]XP_055926316.1 nipped-B-like protein [Argiope bruennichi]XP_055926317.1 nipped-B-like protein [Argiope bruennichi]XP_055926318.1 nipped-B-like protein [Argiope bruennichi]XP_055926319.1 nipped-B-like protein [Argiope bruennichi]XP_055926320.1 nipped-B-like protein [Argiope bruen